MRINEIPLNSPNSKVYEKIKNNLPLFLRNLNQNVLTLTCLKLLEMKWLSHIKVSFYQTKTRIVELDIDTKQ